MQFYRKESSLFGVFQLYSWLYTHVLYSYLYFIGINLWGHLTPDWHQLVSGAEWHVCSVVCGRTPLPRCVEWGRNADTLEGNVLKSIEAEDKKIKWRKLPDHLGFTNQELCVWSKVVFHVIHPFFLFFRNLLKYFFIWQIRNVYLVIPCGETVYFK